MQTYLVKVWHGDREIYFPYASMSQTEKLKAKRNVKKESLFEKIVCFINGKLRS